MIDYTEDIPKQLNSNPLGLDAPWATYIPIREPQVKMHNGPGPAKSAILHKFNHTTKKASTYMELYEYTNLGWLLVLEIPRGAYKKDIQESMRRL